ncbi:MAG: ABC transporter ATP-binding protein [Alphaproteobacteria bacterium]|nr:ABC transporter ATP-binding protein [Alphaproteobacteria bacterium]
MSAPILAATGLTKRFGGLLAVDGVDFEIARGEIVGLIGPNGAGKTTFVDLLTGVQMATSGSIRLGERDATRLSAHERSRLGLARTFQIPRPFQDMTILENVMVGALFGVGGRAVGMEAARRQATDALARAGLGGLADRRTDILTTSGRKRLEIARCLAAQPMLLFLDEPLGGLNATEVNEALDLIRTLRDGGVTIVFIEHIVPAVMSVSDRVFVLAGGRKLAEGKPAEILADGAVRRAYLGDVGGAVRRYRPAATPAGGA